MRAAKPWTEGRVETLRRLWGAGVTAQAIADRLGGISRSAVLGKLFRLRLGPAVSAPAPADKLPSKPRGRGRGKSLLALANDCCRWPSAYLGRLEYQHLARAVNLGALWAAVDADVDRGLRRLKLTRRAFNARKLQGLRIIARELVRARVPIR
jgi:hypothetical protein